MKPLLKIAASGDWHYGLTVENIDRTPDVHAAVMFAVDEAIKAGVKIFSIGGDLTENNCPVPDHIALLIQVINKLSAAGIIVFIMRGNHCAISAKDRRWGLTPLEQVGWENVYFITEPKILKVLGHSFLFLPHVTKAHALEAGYKTAQEFITKEAEKLVDGSKEQLTVISHYNIAGVKCGTEAMMLRQTDLQLPAIVQRSPKVIKIINSHIHTAQEDGKLILPGSVVCTDFGDLDSPKGFIIGDLSKNAAMSLEWKFKKILTPASPMQQLELDLINATPQEIMKVLAQAIKSVLPDSIVKVRVLINEENLPLVNMDALRDELLKKARYVKQIDKVITRKRQMRDAQQKVGMSPISAATHYLGTRNPEGKERKLELARSIIEGHKVAKPEAGHEFVSQTTADDALTENLKQLAAEQPTVRRPKTTVVPKPAPKAPPKPRPVDFNSPAPITEFDF